MNTYRVIIEDEDGTESSEEVQAVDMLTAWSATQMLLPHRVSGSRVVAVEEVEFA